LWIDVFIPTHENSNTAPRRCAARYGTVVERSNVTIVAYRCLEICVDIVRPVNGPVVLPENKDAHESDHDVDVLMIEGRLAREEDKEENVADSSHFLGLGTAPVENDQQHGPLDVAHRLEQKAPQNGRVLVPDVVEEGFLDLVRVVQMLLG
jgi:hypothetical protein